jgi:hypothetical protein
MTMLKSLMLGLAALGALALWTTAQAGGDKAKAHGGDNHVMVRPDSIQWGPGPPALPGGVKAAVLTGDPTKSGPYVLRAQMPDGYKVPPHWHPTDENVTVLKGTLMVGKGETFNPTTSIALPAGSFMRMPAKMHHFASAKGETIIQVHGIGPFEINYVNAADDPRKN